MNNPERLQIVKQEIRKLEREQKELEAEDTNRQIEHIKSLEWTKRVSAHLHIKQVCAYGTPKFIITLGGIYPQVSMPVRVFGESNRYEETIVYGHNSSYYLGDFIPNNSTPVFYTSSKETLIEFLKVVKFKAFEFDIESYYILTAAYNLRKQIENV